jgi:hypothetical protein
MSPRAVKAEEAQQQGKAATRRRAERGGKATNREEQRTRIAGRLRCCGLGNVSHLALLIEFSHHAKACSHYRLKPIQRDVCMARNAEIQIGELSRRTGCNIETIRYYERIGMLPPPPRSASRYRLYEAGDVHR